MLREDDGTLQWFKEYIEDWEENGESYLKDPTNQESLRKLKAYIAMNWEMYESLNPKKDKYSWEK